MLFGFGTVGHTNELQPFTKGGSEAGLCSTITSFKSAYLCMLNRSNEGAVKPRPAAEIIIDEGCSELIRHAK